MKIGAECIPCLFERAKFECDLVFASEATKIGVLKEIMENIAPRLKPEEAPATLGTLRERIIRKRSGTHDPYLALKIESDKAARLALKALTLPSIEGKKWVEDLIRMAAAANTMEYGVKGHDFHHSGFAATFNSIVNGEFLYDARITEAVNAFDKILYLTDNTGEAVFDDYVAKRLRENGKKVVVSPKAEPIINDATAEDLRRSRLFEGFEIVHSCSSVGLDLGEASEEFKKLFWDKGYLVIAKGMGYYETISEFQDKLRGRLVYVLRAKCEPVARSLGVKRGAVVARLY